MELLPDSASPRYHRKLREWTTINDRVGGLPGVPAVERAKRRLFARGLKDSSPDSAFGRRRPPLPCLKERLHAKRTLSIDTPDDIFSRSSHSRASERSHGQEEAACRQDLIEAEPPGPPIGKMVSVLPFSEEHAGCFWRGGELLANPHHQASRELMVHLHSPSTKVRVLRNHAPWQDMDLRPQIPHPRSGAEEKQPGTEAEDEKHELDSGKDPSTGAWPSMSWRSGAGPSTSIPSDFLFPARDGNRASAKAKAFADSRDDGHHRKAARGDDDSILRGEFGRPSRGGLGASGRWGAGDGADQLSQPSHRADGRQPLLATPSDGLRAVSTEKKNLRGSSRSLAATHSLPALTIVQLLEPKVFHTAKKSRRRKAPTPLNKVFECHISKEEQILRFGGLAEAGD